MTGSREDGELGKCLQCGHIQYDSPIITPIAGELRTQKYIGPRLKVALPANPP